jgi:hypothetical protein
LRVDLEDGIRGKEGNGERGMVPQRQEPIVPPMLGTPLAFQPGSWLKTSVFGGWNLRHPATSREEV